MPRFSKAAIVTSGGIIVVLGLILFFSAKVGANRVDRISHADPEIQAAAKKAQNEIDIFIREIKNPVPGDQFFVKGAFKSDEGAEYLWVRRVQYEGGYFVGILDQPPMVYRNAAKGDTVRVKQGDAYDWMIKNGSHMRGGYTEKVLGSR